MTNVISQDTQLQENHKPPPKKIRKINTDLSDQEEEEETLEYEDITENTDITGISFFTNAANEQFLEHTLTDQKEI